MLSMPDIVLKLLGPVFVLLTAAIAWGLDNKWRDRRTRNRRRWIRALLAVIILGSLVNGATIWHGHIEEQTLQQRMARIDEGVTELVTLARERNPGLTEHEALNEVIEELLTLRERTSGLALELQGLKRYSSVAELDAFGLSGMAGLGLKETSAISRVLENAYLRKGREGQVRSFPRCDSVGTAAFEDAATLNPDFPFAHWALAVCAHSDKDPSWQVHAQRAITILEHTTQIAGHHPHHDAALKELMKLLSD